MVNYELLISDYVIAAALLLGLPLKNSTSLGIFLKLIRHIGLQDSNLGNTIFFSGYLPSTSYCSQYMTPPASALLFTKVVSEITTLLCITLIAPPRTELFVNMALSDINKVRFILVLVLTKSSTVPCATSLRNIESVIVSFVTYHSLVPLHPMNFRSVMLMKKIFDNSNFPL